MRILHGLTLLPVLFAQGSVERIKVHGKSLEGNLIGDSPDRDVAVYLPKSYATDKRRRFPVVYMLHGFTDSVEKWWSNPKHWINLPMVLDKAATDFIVVMPDAYNSFQGSFYSSSATIGDWETFVAREVVAAIDAKYRTISRVASRGLAGHSMGGYGAMRLGMKYPDVFGAVYLMSACCMTPMGGGPSRPSKASDIKSLEEFAKADFGTKAQISGASAWSPNPKNPPLYIDLPSAENKDALARLTANATLANVDQYIANIRRLRALGIDCGDKDGLLGGSKALHERLDMYGVTHDYAVYEGNHINGVAGRIQNVVVPFFAKHLQMR